MLQFNLHWLDTIVVIIFIYYIFTSALKGFSQVLFSLLGTISGIYISSKYFHTLSVFLNQKIHFPQNKILLLASFILIWLAIYLIFFLIGKLVHKTLEVLLIGWLDHLIGCILGAFKGIIAIIILYATLLYLPLSNKFHNEVKNTKIFIRLNKTITIDYNKIVKLLNNQGVAENEIKRFL